MTIVLRQRRRLRVIEEPVREGQEYILSVSPSVHNRLESIRRTAVAIDANTLETRVYGAPTEAVPQRYSQEEINARHLGITPGCSARLRGIGRQEFYWQP